MNVIVNSKNISVGESLTTYIQDHITGMVTKYFDHTFDVDVTLAKNNNRVSAEIGAHVGRGIVLRSHADSLDPYASFDAAFHKVETRLKRYKQRVKDHHSKHAVQHQELHYLLPHDYGHRPPAPAEVPVIAEFMEEIPTLSVRDAVMRMDLSEAPAFVFRNDVHGGINVLHRRADGNIGWIDPKGAKNIHKIA